MPKVVIIGCGFGGLSCALTLSKANRGLEIAVIDRKETFDFLPLLPDIIGREINPKILACDIKTIAKENGFEFIREEVSSIDLQKREICAGDRKINYDYLVIASGTETNFYGNDSIKNSAYTLDSVNDAVKLLSVLKENWFDNFIIAGGGYTGVEIATSLRRFSLGRKQNTKITIVEKTESILGALPQWIKDYTTRNFWKLKIEVLAKSTIDRIDGRVVHISGLKMFGNALIIWVAGVKTTRFVQELNANKNAQGRLTVDKYLRLDRSCFVIGDAAYVRHERNYLRMAVQFAITQGQLSAANIARSIKGKQLIEYKPVDLGYIIPMANNYSCGTVFGLNLKGKIPTLLHFIMCTYRLYGAKNKMELINNLTGKKR